MALSLKGCPLTSLFLSLPNGGNYIKAEFNLQMQQNSD